MPYPYAPGFGDEYSETYVFPTDNGSFYIIDFFKSFNRFSDSDEILLNSKLLFEIVIKCQYLDVPPSKSQRNDPEVYPTIKDILDKHIDAHGVLSIYFFVCDNSDGKEAARHKLFTNKWYQESQLENWIMFVYEIEDTENLISSYYIGLLIHSDHPNVEIYPKLFEEFMMTEVAQGKMLNGGRV